MCNTYLDHVNVNLNVNETDQEKKHRADKSLAVIIFNAAADIFMAPLI